MTADRRRIRIEHYADGTWGVTLFYASLGPAARTERFTYRRDAALEFLARVREAKAYYKSLRTGDHEACYFGD